MRRGAIVGAVLVLLGVLATGVYLIYTNPGAPTGSQISEKPTTQQPKEKAAEPPKSPQEKPSTTKVYRVGIFADPTTMNIWHRNGPQTTVWNSYVQDDYHNRLFVPGDKRFNWLPGLAADFHSPFEEVAMGGTTHYVSTVKLRKGITWSDGKELTAEDVRFTYETIQAFGPVELGGNWPQYLSSSDLLAQVEVVDPYTVKFHLTKKPGLAEWNFGMMYAPIVPKAFWEPKVKPLLQARDQALQEAARLSDPKERDAAMAKAKADAVQSLYGVDPQGEPSIGSFMLGKWERGAFVENAANPQFALQGERLRLYANGAAEIINSKLGYRWSGYGTPQGDVDLEITTGPDGATLLFSIYANQDAAVLALQRGEIDFIINPLGLQKGFQDRLSQAPDVKVTSNDPYGFRYLGFNFRRPPMDHQAFRQAVATLIDREFVTQNVLQGVAVPFYSLVPPGNSSWFNPDVPVYGKEGLKVNGRSFSRAERIQEAVRLLKNAGFRWEREPRVENPGTRDETITEGQGLTMPDGKPVPQLELLAPSAGYDPLRSTFALFIEDWLNQVGIPVKANLTGFNLIVDRVFTAQDFDMWILGWSLGDPSFPDFLYYFFHSRFSNPGGQNAVGYADPDFDRLAQEFIEATDLEQAHEIANRLQVMLATDLPYVVLFDSPILEAYRADHLQFPYTQVLGGLQFMISTLENFMAKVRVMR